MSKNLTNDYYLRVTSLSVNNITINAPQNATYTLILPTSAGTSGQYLATNGSGVLSWSSSFPPSAIGTNLTLSGTLTAATVNVTGLTASRVVATDGSRNLVSVDPAILRLSSGNTDFSVLGSSDPDDATNTRIIISGNSRGGTPGGIEYVCSSTGSHVWRTASATLRMNLSSGGVLNISGLTPSNAVATDAGRNLVSVLNTGSGSNVLAVNPSFTGTSNGFTSTTSAANGSCTFIGSEGGGLIIQSTGATNSSIVDLVNVSSAGQFSTNAAAGDFVLRTRTARALHFQSGNLAAAMTITTSNTVNVLTTLTASGGLIAASPTFSGTTSEANLTVSGTASVTGITTLGTCIMTLARFSTDASGIPKICMFGIPPNNFQYDGFSTLTNTLAYNAAGTANSHVFFAGTSSTTRQELFRIAGGGGFTSTGAGIVNGNFTVNGNVNLPVLGYMEHNMTGNFGIPNNTNTTVGNWNLTNNVGNQLTITGGNSWYNNLGRAVHVTLNWSTRYNANSGNCTYWAATNISGTLYGYSTRFWDQWNSTSATFRLGNGDFFVVRSYQNSGFGQDILANQSSLIITIF